MDEAFCFYYQDNLETLEAMNAELRFFSPIHDEKVPGEADGLYLGGGYPELYGKELSENASMRASVRERLAPLVVRQGGKVPVFFYAVFYKFQETRFHDVI